VRRITGGGAIWHEHELTYAVVFPVGGPLPERCADCYPLLHGAIAAALHRRGATLQRQEQSCGDRRYREEPRCFAAPAADDLILGQAKVLGSAGRLRGGRMLIHGSLKLASNPWDGPCVCGCGLSPEQAREALREGLINALGGEAEPGEPSDEELSTRDELLRLRYADPAWVERREGPRA
jgi:lipoate-protein ligase A